MGAPTFTNDEMLEQAKGNASAITLITVAYLKQTGASATDWTRFASAALAPTWRVAADFDASQLAHIWALNFASTGGAVQSLQGDAQRAELVVSDWPSGDVLAALGLTREDADPLLEIVPLLMGSVGATGSCERAGDTLHIVITR
ncbi:MAG TPA: hypothetical protein VFU60_19535 [Ktedonobacterales bacterium]|jgi:hypothetical protein|nr:hypothetical protein [Ktedonobacterales bacterium]